jgi:hypothetical protein
MEINYLLWSGLWLIVSAFFAAFIVFFGRAKFASPKLGLFYVLLFFVIGVAMLLLSVRSLR